MGGDIIVGTPKREWQILVRKVERGVTLEDALEQSGIPQEEFEDHIKERMALGTLDDALLQLTASHAIKVGVQKLVEIAGEGPRYSETRREGDSVTTTTPISTDLDAAKALVAFGLKTKSMAQVAALKTIAAKGGKAEELPPDLWDVAKLGPWDKLRNPMDA